MELKERLHNSFYGLSPSSLSNTGSRKVRGWYITRWGTAFKTPPQEQVLGPARSLKNRVLNQMELIYPTRI